MDVRLDMGIRGSIEWTSHKRRNYFLSLISDSESYKDLFINCNTIACSQSRKDTKICLYQNKGKPAVFEIEYKMKHSSV